MRVKGGTTRHQHHKKIKKLAKGFRGHRRRTFKGANQGVANALVNSYIGRKLKKRNMRRLWIIRLNAALRNQGLSYSKFVHILKEQQIELDRKVLSEMAYQDYGVFLDVVKQILDYTNKQTDSQNHKSKIISSK